MARCSSGRRIANCQFDSQFSSSAPMANPPDAGRSHLFPLTTPPLKVFVQIGKLSGFLTLICGTAEHGPFFHAEVLDSKAACRKMNGILGENYDGNENSEKFGKLT